MSLSQMDLISESNSTKWYWFDIHKELTPTRSEEELLHELFAIYAWAHNWIITEFLKRRDSSDDLIQSFFDDYRNQQKLSSEFIDADIMDSVATEAMIFVKGKYDQHLELESSDPFHLRIKLGLIRKLITGLDHYPVSDNSLVCNIKHIPGSSKYTFFAHGAVRTTKTKLECGIDLGVKTFVTVYSESDTYSIADNPCESFIANWNQIQKITKSLKTPFLTPNQKQRLNRTLHKYHARIQNKIRDLHHKVAHEILKAYDVVYVGKITVPSQANPRTQQMFDLLNFPQFIKLLHELSLKYKAKVFEIDEYLTTKRCSNCHRINNVGPRKFYSCRCNFETDRNRSKTGTP